MKGDVDIPTRREVHLLVICAGLILQAVAVWRHERRSRSG